MCAHAVKARVMEYRPRTLAGEIIPSLQRMAISWELLNGHFAFMQEDPACRK